eukprot:5160501-Amphidinium_carterae.1
MTGGRFAGGRYPTPVRMHSQSLLVRLYAAHVELRSPSNHSTPPKIPKMAHMAQERVKNGFSELSGSSRWASGEVLNSERTHRKAIDSDMQHDVLEDQPRTPSSSSSSFSRLTPSLSLGVPQRSSKSLTCARSLCMNSFAARERRCNKDARRFLEPQFPISGISLWAAQQQHAKNPTSCLLPLGAVNLGALNS